VSSKALQKTFCKKIVSKSFYKKIDKKSKTQSRIFLDFVYDVFGRFSVRGVQTHDKKLKKIFPTLVLALFLPPRNQPTTWGPVGFFLCPWPLISGIG
jgi:hypothetical protein